MKRLRIYIILFFLLLIPLIALNNFWKQLDYAVYKSFYLYVSEEDKFLRPDIALIDLPYNSNVSGGDRRENYRSRMADLLFTIDSIAKPELKPKAVILDIWFSQDKIGLDTLKKAIKKLRDDGIRVYAVFNMLDYKDAMSFEERNNKMDIELYDKYLDGKRLHNLFYARHDVVSYSSLIHFKKEDGQDKIILSLPFKVAKDDDKMNYKKSDSTVNKNFILPLGDQKELENRTYTFKHEAGKTRGGIFEGPSNNPLSINGIHLIVCSLEADYKKNIEQSGPHLLAWALNDQLKPVPIAKKPMESMVFIMAMLLFFSFFVAQIYALLFKFVRKLQTKPRIISALSFLIGTFLYLGTGFLLLNFMDTIIPIGLTLVSMLMVSLMAAHFCNKFLITKFAEGSDKYDVFISYSHAHKDEVKKNIYQPLSEFTKSNGEKLNIFFDEKSIGIGEAFTSKYMWGIVDSKYFVSFISEDYYGKSHCKNELDLAYFRTLENPPLIQIYPIAKDIKYVPEIYRPRLTNVIDGKDDCIQDLLKKLDDEK